MLDEVIVIGGGGHAKVVMDCICAAGDTIFGILDDNLSTNDTVLGFPVLGKTTDFEKYRNHPFLIAIGNNNVRKQFAQVLNVTWYTAIHPRAVVSRYARIGAGSVILPMAVVNAGASVGKHCIINTGAIIEHDDRIEDYVHISPAAALGGTVHIGEGTHVGIGAAVRNNITVCGGTTVGAGAVVVKNITESGIYVGVPAHRQ